MQTTTADSSHKGELTLVWICWLWPVAVIPVFAFKMEFIIECLTNSNTS